jgi:phospholipid/cholesterol/gamma-HCH transport system ATP-binding protein
VQQRLRTTVMMVTHDIGEAFALAGLIGVVDSGQLLVYGTAARVAASTDPRVRRFIDSVPRPPGS